MLKFDILGPALHLRTFWRKHRTADKKSTQNRLIKDLKISTFGIDLNIVNVYYMSNDSLK